MQGQVIEYSEPVEVPVINGTIQRLGLPVQYNNIEDGFVLGVRSYSSTETPFAPSGLAVIPSNVLAASFLTLADDVDEKLSQFPLKDLNLYQQTNVNNLLPKLKIRLSKSYVFIADPSLLVANVGKVVLLQFLYQRKK